MVLTLEDGENFIVDSGDDIENEDIERLESGVGTLYILGTNTYTKGGEEIVKIGITTGSVDSRINQLYTTGVPFKFRLIKQYSTTEYFKVEKILHLILDKYRTSKSREFFADGCIQHIENILAIINDAKK
ncbi:GIY-YIG nuclease family protein [Acidithiobacillus ferrivorans]|nr:GIY-YIG nuclease family protein [Acidithiobacillus ferrivorans]